jgi:hypothetical protein
MLAGAVIAALVPSGAAASRRVTELVSKSPSLGFICSVNIRNGCETLVTPDAKNLVFQAGNGVLYKWSARGTVAVSVGPNGPSENCHAEFMRDRCNFEISDDGRHVFFESRAALVPGDSNDLDVYERSGGETTLVSALTPPGVGPFNARLLGSSDDGARAFFQVHPGRDFEAEGVLVYERSGGGIAPFPSADNPALFNTFGMRLLGASNDGSRVFFSTEQALIPEDTDTCIDHYFPSLPGCRDVYERSPDGLTLISKGPTGGNGASNADFAGASENGRRVFFATDEPLVDEDRDECGQPERPAGCSDVYQAYRGTTTLISTGPLHAAPDSYASFDGTSSDGKRVVFTTGQALVAADHDSCPGGEGCLDVYERSGGETRLISTGPEGGNGPNRARFTGMSRDGRHISFSTSESLTPDDTDQSEDLYERAGGTTRLVSVGVTSDDSVGFAGISADGRRIFFYTSASLVPEDTDECYAHGEGCVDLYERYKGKTALISTGPTDPNGYCNASFGDPFCPGFIAASRDGKKVFFASEDPLVAADDDDVNDIYVSTVTGRCHAKKHGHKQKKCADSARHRKHRKRHK